jgi:hypothetical protein
VRTQQPDRGQRHRAGGKQAEDHGKALRRTSRVDAVTGGILREPQHLRAVAEEGPAALRGIREGRASSTARWATFLRRRLTLAAGKRGDPVEKIVIGET